MFTIWSSISNETVLCFQKYEPRECAAHLVNPTSKKGTYKRRAEQGLWKNQLSFQCFLHNSHYTSPWTPSYFSSKRNPKVTTRIHHLRLQNVSTLRCVSLSNISQSTDRYKLGIPASPESDEGWVKLVKLLLL
jgi:hypothetical protein